LTPPIFSELKERRTEEIKLPVSMELPIGWKLMSFIFRTPIHASVKTGLSGFQAENAIERSDSVANRGGRLAPGLCYSVQPLALR
jgi:hypothetical protein